MEQYIGKLLDNRYEILERIGTGGMAVVYKARCHRLNRLVAIKILKEDLAQDADFRRRFHDESQAVAMLSHPNIMAVYDVSKSTEVDYIVMELIDGITLKQYMQKKGGKLSWREALHFITQIMKALSHAHGRGIIHRDIKPHNIMVLRDGSIKVADFGIARLTSAAQNTLTQEALGSVHYISPEQAKGSHIDARSDIYSAGVVLYEMITGRLPYEGDSPVSVAIQHINSVPLAPRELEADIPEALEAITLKAMASDVNQRYISADAMLLDLEEFRKNPNINFDFTSADLILNDGDEPTMVLGSNTPSSVHAQPTHAVRRGEDDTMARRRNTGTYAVRRDSFIDDEDDDYDNRPRRRKGSGMGPVITAVIAIIIVIGVLAYFLWSAFFRGIFFPPEVLRAPELAGMTPEAALKLPEIKENNIKIEIGENIYSDQYPEGQIANQEPKAKAALPTTDAVITVQISLGKTNLSMPDYYGKDARAAEIELKSLGFSVKLETKNSEDITVDYVMEQSPKAGSPLEKGQEVTLVKSLGPEAKMVTVIPFSGKTIEEVKKIVMQDLKLKIGSIDRKYSSEIIEGYVMQQSILQGTQVPEGTEISFTVSKGPDPAVVSPGAGPSAIPSTAPSTNTTPPSVPVVPVPREISVELPQDGRETVSVRVQVGSDANAFNNPIVETKVKQINPTIYGNGEQEVIVYIDEVAGTPFIVHF